MSERMTTEQLNEWRGMTPVEVMRECERARHWERCNADRVRALEVQQAELIRQTKEKDATIKSLRAELAVARATIARLTAAGQALSEHVDRTTGEPT